MNAVLEIVKKNLMSIICGVIAILACVAVWFWPLPGKFDQLNKDLAERKTELAAMESLATKSRQLPMIEPDAEPKKLDRFPTDEIIRSAEMATQQIASESKAVQELAEKLNKHELLVPNSLPNPGDGPVGYTYVEAYQKMMDFTNSDPAIRNETLPIKILHAGLPPSPQEIETERKKRSDEILGEQVKGTNDDAIRKQIAQMEASVANDMQQEVAARAAIYINPDSFSIYPGVFGASKAPTREGTTTPSWAPLIWHSQIGLWVQQDVCDALAAANKGSDSVMTSPVKHLVKIVVHDVGAGAQTAVAPTNGESAPVSRAGITGRSTNSTYELIPFNLVIYVDATKVPQVLTELSKNKFITITRCDLVAIDVGAQALAGFYYGSKPVVALNLDCEELFLKSWLSKFTPNLGAPAAAPAPE